jgi:hypothetical protein
MARYLADLGLLWDDATPVERNKLALELFNKVVVANRTVVEPLPRPDLFPFFSAPAQSLSTVSWNGRKRRGSVQRLLSTSTADTAFASPTSGPALPPNLGGHHGVAQSHPRAIVLALVS